MVQSTSLDVRSLVHFISLVSPVSARAAFVRELVWLFILSRYGLCGWNPSKSRGTKAIAIGNVTLAVCMAIGSFFSGQVSDRVCAAVFLSLVFDFPLA